MNTNPSDPKCPNCGGPVHRTPGVRDLRCPFCHADLSFPTIAAQSGGYQHPGGGYPQQPGGYQPPPMAPIQPMAPITASGPSPVVLIVAVAGVLVALVGAGVAMFVTSRAHAIVDEATQRGPNGVNPSQADDKPLGPMPCPLNGNIKITGKTYDGKGVLISPEINCEITIENSHIKTDTLVRGGTNVKITIIDSTVDARENAVELGINGELTVKHSEITAKHAAFRGDVNAKVRLENQSKLSGKENGVVATDNLEVTIDQSGIEGGIAIKGNNNTKIRSDGGKIVGHHTGVEVAANLDATFDKTTIEGKHDGIKGESNAHIVGHGGSINGGKAALAFSGKPNLELHGTKIEGAQNFEGGDKGDKPEKEGKHRRKK